MEDASVGVLPVYHQEGFDSAEEALHDFGKAVFVALENVRGYHNNHVNERINGKRFHECCEITLLANPSSIYCVKCVGEIRCDNKVTTREQVLDYIEHMKNATNDDSRYEVIEGINNEGWEPGQYMPRTGSSLLLHVDNYDWHPDFNKFGNGSSEWQISEVNVGNYTYYNNNPKQLYHRDDGADETCEPEE